ncbi:MAG: ATP-dependent sacrificial sulfur transferase LarE [Firmicutes bacterium]|nr:ATP-dependent sacrificial sulfur transferase LarE [Bacillota bacterium]
MSLHKKYQKLLNELTELGRDGLVICFSGGVDSTLLAAAAAEACADSALLLTFVTPTIAHRDLTEAAAIGRELGLAHQMLELDTLAIPEVRSNDVMRCYHCKRALYQAADRLAKELGYAHIADGCNVDDENPQIYRPGMKAADELNVIHPLITAGLTKEDIRGKSKELGLFNHDRPASPCLISRFPYNTELTREALERVENGEIILREMGFTDFRLRSHGQLARLEVAAEEEAAALEQRSQICDKLERLGYEFVCLDLGGLVSGSYDKGLKNE